MTDTKPRFEFHAAMNLGFDIEHLAAARDWIEANADKNEFAASLKRQDFEHGGLTYSQWKAAIDASQGKTRRRSRKSRNDSVDSVDTSKAVDSVDTSAIVNSRSIKLSPKQRSTVRKALARSPNWPAYKAMSGANTGKDKKSLFDACDACGVDIAATIAGDIAAKHATFDAIGNAPSDGAVGVDWSRVRRIAKEEIERRIAPVVTTQLVIDQGKRRDPVNVSGVKHPKFDLALSALLCTENNGRYIPILLVGPAGTGKSFACRQFADALGIDFYFQSIAIESYDLLGYEKVNGEYKETAFLKAFRDGGLVLLDEIDGYDEKAVIAVNAALANGEMALLDGTIIKAHKDFRCVGAANTHGLGATSDYTARNKLDLSTLSRFAIRVDWHQDDAIELEIARAARGDIGAAWCIEVQAVRAALSRLDLPPLADQRCIEAGSAMLENGIHPDFVRELTYFSALDSDQRNAIKGLVDAAKLVRV